MPFAKGQSGNPSGRPRQSPDLKRLCRDLAGDCVEALQKSLQASGAERVQAANTLLAYGFGKPVARIDHRVIRSFSDLSDEELTAIMGAGEAEDGASEALH